MTKVRNWAYMGCDTYRCVPISKGIHVLKYDMAKGPVDLEDAIRIAGLDVDFLGKTKKGRYAYLKYRVNN